MEASIRSVQVIVNNLQLCTYAHFPRCKQGWVSFCVEGAALYASRMLIMLRLRDLVNRHNPTQV